MSAAPSESTPHKRILGDALEVLPTLPRSFDLLLTDPPYAMPATYYAGRNVRRRWSDSSILTGWWRFVMERASAVLRPDAMVAVFANGNAVAAFWPVMYECCRPLQLAVWDKGRIGMGSPLRNQAEFIIIGSMGTTFATDAGGVQRFSILTGHPNEAYPSSPKTVAVTCGPSGTVVAPRWPCAGPICGFW